MTTANISRMLPHLRRVVGEHETALPDEELLRRYLSASDQSAFAALVQRHGAMVFAVSQSVLRQRHDAEDAFQTAFLILARKANTIRRQEREAIAGQTAQETPTLVATSPTAYCDRACRHELLFRPCFWRSAWRGAHLLASRFGMPPNPGRHFR